MPYEYPITVRNKKKGRTVFDPDNNNTGIVWEGHGDPGGGDFQVVPVHVANNPVFSRALKRGLLEEVDANTAQEAFDRQGELFQEQQKRREEKATTSIDQASNRSIVSNKCLGPNDRGSGECGLDVVGDINEEPPLCTKHSHMKSQFVSADDWVNGEKVVRWHRVALSNRESGPTQ